MKGSAEVLAAIADAVRPLERLSPSAFAAKHRRLKEGSGPISGKWVNEHPFPYLAPIMDAVEEALREGKRGVVLVKSTQGGGTDALGVNVPMWLQTFYPGPLLYLTSKKEVAEELVHDRWAFALEHCEPLRRKQLLGRKHHEKVLIKRFTDGKIVFTTSASVLNLISNAYRFAIVDEADSVADHMTDGSDPIALVLKRTTAFAEGGATLTIAFAHPTVRERGVARIYESESDQRRGHVACPHCGAWIAPRWDHIRSFPRAGQSPEQAQRDASSYRFVAPCCGAEWTDADRLKAIRVVEQRSTLPPEVAKTRDWIGLHFWAFFQPAMTVRAIAREFVAGLDDPATMRVFWNKTLGEAFEEKIQEVTVAGWRRLAPEEGTPRSYALGTVPAPVQFLTAGQDSRELELHWAVYGWGLERTREAGLVLCGWLVDCGVEDGPRRRNPAATGLLASDLEPLDQVLYGRFWPRVEEDEQLPVAQVFHDSGWQPTAVYEFCRDRVERAVPSKGAAVDDRSRAPLVTWSGGLRYLVGDVAVDAPHLRRADLNTFLAKCDLAGFTTSTFLDATGASRARLALPHDVPESFLEHLASERLARNKRGRRTWVKRAPNHFFDCTVLAYASALNVRAVLDSGADPLLPRAELLIADQAARASREDELDDNGPPPPHEGPPPSARRIRARYQ